MAIKLIEIQSVFFPFLIWRGVKISCQIPTLQCQTLQTVGPALYIFTVHSATTRGHVYESLSG